MESANWGGSVVPGVRKYKDTKQITSPGVNTHKFDS